MNAENAKRKKMGRGKKALLIVSGIIIALAITVGVVIALQVSSDEWYTVLLVGTDRGDEDSLVEVENGRADAIMLASFNFSNGETRLLSVERDLMIVLPEVGRTKLCISAFFGGPELLRKKTEELFRLNIDAYASIDLNRLEALVDAIGGVDLEVEEAELYITQRDGALAFDHSGYQHLNGIQAQAYVQNRSADSDAKRNERQRKVIDAILHGVKNMGKTELLGFASKAYSFIDTNVEFTDIAKLAIAALVAGIKTPLEMRTPLTSTRKLINLHYLQIVDDMGAEINRVRTFLYGTNESAQNLL